jgi:radical SAM family uncharacterized protein
LKELLSLVQKPVRYLGRETGSITKNPADVKLRFCLAFPDAYEVGMSHLGIQVLYHILNAKPGVACERAFAPWVDMEKVLREKRVPLSSLESSTPLRQFDILGFSLQYELCFTNVLNMLDLSDIPFFAKDRDDRFPLIIAGGPTAFNPEPVADFFDALVIGDGEEVVLDICDLVLRGKEPKAKKEDLLRSLSQLDGVYVPSLHGPGQKVRKRFVSDLDRVSFPTCPIVPFMRVVHDRLNVEIARGCKRGCRFCEAGFIYRPYRERSSEVIEEILNDSLKKTGYEEFSLLSLSAGDYSSIGPLLSRLMDRFESEKVAVSFPSLRIESVVGTLAEEVKRVRKTGFTVAPEAGTERLRKVINKEMDENVLFQGLSDLFAKGWRNVKLYFMLGLPTAKEEDLRGILDLSRRIASLAHKQKVFSNINVSVSTFVPKPHTPFQWEPQIPLEEMKEQLHLLKDEMKRARLGFKWQDPHLSHLEAVFSRGDRSLSRALVEAHRLGCRFDGWSDQFRYPLWREAFEKAGLQMDRYTRRREPEEALPWSFIETGTKPGFLWEEYQRGLKGESTPPCRKGNCDRCGVCDGKTITVRESRPGIGTTPSIGKAGLSGKGMKRKFRLRFKKAGDLRYISHLELAHLFYRASKRAGLPLSHSEGFHPLPKIIFATALPVGVESLTEVVDIELEGKSDLTDVNPSARACRPGSPESLSGRVRAVPERRRFLTPSSKAAQDAAEWVKERLNPVLPRGVEIVDAEEVPLSSSLSSLIHRSAYWILPDHVISKEEAVSRIKRALEEGEIPIHQERKGKKRTVDIRPVIERMSVEERAESSWGVELVLRRVEGRTAKPSEIIGTILGLEGESLKQCEIIKVQ